MIILPAQLQHSEEKQSHLSDYYCTAHSMQDEGYNSSQILRRNKEPVTDHHKLFSYNPK
jgi:hypothetical protein